MEQPETIGDAARAETQQDYDAQVAAAERQDEDAFGPFGSGWESGREYERAQIAARRDKVEEAIMRVRDAYPRRPDDAPSDEVTDAVLAALGGVLDLFEPETVTTAAELDALPVGSVVLSTAHDYMEAPALARQRRGWFGAWDWDAPIRAEEIAPAVVLHRGGDR